VFFLCGLLHIDLLRLVLAGVITQNIARNDLTMLIFNRNKKLLFSGENKMSIGNKSAKLTWRDVFDCKKQYGHINDIAWTACDAGYSYFAWNDRVYKITNSIGEHESHSNISDITFALASKGAKDEG
jgi:hypothetical protein